MNQEIYIHVLVPALRSTIGELKHGAKQADRDARDEICAVLEANGYEISGKGEGRGADARVKKKEGK